MKSTLIVFVWLLAILLAASLLLWRQKETSIQINLKNVGNVDKATITAKAKQINASTTLIEPRFTGRNKNGQTWDLHADSAERTGALTEDLITLNKITATLDSNTTDPITFKSTSGNYSAKEQRLNLSGNVLVYGYGIKMKTSKLNASLEKRTIEAGPFVTIESTWSKWNGTITGKKLTLTNNGPEIVLEGNVHGHFEQIPFIPPYSDEKNRIED